MTDFLQTILSALGPSLADFLAMALTALFAWIGLALRKNLGLEAERLWRELLDKAINTGVEKGKAIQGSASPTDVIVDTAVEYARRSAPDAIKGLKASTNILVDKARAALNR